MAGQSRDPLTVVAASAPVRKGSTLPEPMASRVAMREKHALGDLFGLRAFGVNLTRVPAGGASSIHHRHTREDELVYVLEGTATLVTDEGEAQLEPGMCAGFPANGTAHHLENRTDRDVVVLEIGSRDEHDDVTYPFDDLKLVTNRNGTVTYAHKDGKPY